MKKLLTVIYINNVRLCRRCECVEGILIGLPVEGILALPAFIQALVDVLHTALIEAVELFEGLEGVIDGLLVGCLVEFELHGNNLQSMSL